MFILYKKISKKVHNNYIEMILECMRCQKTFDNKTHYNKHLARKIQCKTNINLNSDNDV